MKHFCVLLLLCIACVAPAKGKHLFPVTKDGGTGYIDSTGALIIPYIYNAGGEFSEGLAPVRKGGLYGYIDVNGQMVIPPQYDYARPFSDGNAVVFEDGKAFCIRYKGTVIRLFEPVYKDIDKYENGHARVISFGKKMGVINEYGKLIIDTAFADIRRFEDGYAVVTKCIAEPLDSDTTNESCERGVIDLTGKLIMNYGMFESLGEYNDGYFMALPVSKERGHSWDLRIIDVKGNEIKPVNCPSACSIETGFSNGYAVVKLSRTDLPANKYGYFSSYYGYMDTTRKIVISDTSFRYAIAFNDNRAFVRDWNEKEWLIDLNGKRIAGPYDPCGNWGFKNGHAFVLVNGKYGIIDTNGTFIVKPTFAKVYPGGRFKNDDFFLFDNGDKYKAITGIANKKGEIVVSQISPRYDDDGFVGGVLKTYQAEMIFYDREVYYNTDGKVIWRQSFNGPDTLNVDYIIRSRYYAPRSLEKDSDYFETSSSLISSDMNVPTNRISIVVDTSRSIVIDGMYYGMNVRIANTTNDEVVFHTGASLNMRMQAMNETGDWIDIERPSFAPCGLGNFNVTLGAGRYWSLSAPIYKGSIRTKLRLALKHYIQNTKPDNFNDALDEGDKPEMTIYSNEFDGSINPAQFWRNRYEDLQFKVFN